MTHTIKDDITITAQDSQPDPPTPMKPWQYLLVDAFISLAPALTFYAITHLLVYARAVPPWAPRAAGLIAWGVAFLGCLFLQLANPGDRA